MIVLLDLSMRQWIMFVVILIVAYLVSWPATKLSLKLTYCIIRQHVPTFDKEILKAAYTPWRMGFGIAFFAFGVRFIDLPENLRTGLPTAEKLAFVFTLTWLVFSVIDVFSDWIKEELGRRDKPSMIAMLPLFRRAIKTSVILLALITLLQNIGINVSALLTGLGIGGIAVALAAQKTLENIFGGIMLMLDQPIRIGDFCKIGTQQGTVEDIGLRSTQIRTPDRTLISIPNSNLSQIAIENIDARDDTRFQTIFALKHETTTEQLKTILKQIRDLINEHKKADLDSLRVRLIGFDTSGLNVEVIVNIRTRNNQVFGVIREELLLDIADIITQNESALTTSGIVRMGNVYADGL